MALIASSAQEVFLQVLYSLRTFRFSEKGKRGERPTIKTAVAKGRKSLGLPQNMIMLRILKSTGPINTHELELLYNVIELTA